MIILDNTVLSNFAVVGQTELLQKAFGNVLATVPQVLNEFEEGVSFGRVPATDWHWLKLLQLSPDEEALEQQFRLAMLWARVSLPVWLWRLKGQINYLLMIVAQGELRVNWE